MNFFHSSIYNFNSLVIASSRFWNNFSTPHWYNLYSKAWSSSFQEWLCEQFLLPLWYIFLPILSSSIQAYVYTILCFSDISLPRADLFPDFIVLTSPHELSADPIPRIFEVTLQATKPRTLVDVKEYLWYHRWLLPSLMSLLLQINSLLSKG